MEISLAAEPVFHIGSFTVTNSLLHAWIASGVLILVAVLVGTNLKRIPRGLQNVLEFLFEWLLNLCDSVTDDRKKSMRFFPIVATIFLFIFVSNYLGLLPGVGSIGIYEHLHGETVLIPFLRSAGADLNTTLALALVAVISTHIFGIGALGVAHHFLKFFQFNKLYTITHGFPIPRPMGVIDFFIGLVEAIGEVSRVVSFSFRLFGNVFAGEVLLLVVASLAAYVAPVPFYFLELFVGFIQAFVFSLLTLVFLSMATIVHEEEHESETGAHNEHEEVARH